MAFTEAGVPNFMTMGSAGGFGEGNGMFALLLGLLISRGGLFGGREGAIGMCNEVGLGPQGQAWILSKMGDIEAGVANCAKQSDVMALENSLLSQFMLQT